MRPDLDTDAIIADYVAGASASSLSRKYKANIWSILDRLRKASIRIRSNKEQNEKRLDLSSQKHSRLVEIVDGLLLGDGSIDPKGSLRLEQAHVRKGWLEDLSKKLDEIGVEWRIVPIYKRTRVLDGRVLRSGGGSLLYTPCYVEIQEQRSRWYPRGVKVVPTDVVLSPLSLAYWLSGDGTGDEAGSLAFYTNGFSKSEVRRLALGLTSQGVEARCVKATQRHNVPKSGLFA